MKAAMNPTKMGGADQTEAAHADQQRDTCRMSPTRRWSLSKHPDRGRAKRLGHLPRRREPVVRVRGALQVLCEELKKREPGFTRF